MSTPCKNAMLVSKRDILWFHRYLMYCWSFLFNYKKIQKYLGHNIFFKILGIVCHWDFCHGAQHASKNCSFYKLSKIWWQRLQMGEKISFNCFTMRQKHEFGLSNHQQWRQYENDMYNDKQLFIIWLWTTQKDWQLSVQSCIGAYPCA